MTQPTLDERFRKGPPIRGSEERRKWMTSDERRFLLWGLKEGWSAARISRALGVNEATVRRFRNRITQEPDVLLQLALYEMVGRVKDDEYRCLVCSDQLLGRTTVERHVLRHYLDESVVIAALPPTDLDSEGAESSYADAASEIGAEPDVAEEQPGERAGTDRLEPTGTTPPSTSEGPDAPPRADEPSYADEPSPTLERADETAAEMDRLREDFERITSGRSATSSLEDLVNNALSRISERRQEFDKLLAGSGAPPTPSVSDTVLPERPAAPDVAESSGPDTPPSPGPAPVESSTAPDQPEAGSPKALSDREPLPSLASTAPEVAETGSPEGHADHGVLTGDSVAIDFAKSASTEMPAVEALAESPAAPQVDEGSAPETPQPVQGLPDASEAPELGDRTDVPSTDVPSVADSSTRHEELEQVIGGPVTTGLLGDTTQEGPDSSEWHEAFERLASMRGVPAPRRPAGQGPPSESTPGQASEGPADRPAQATPAQPSAEAPGEAESRRREFESLRQQSADEPVSDLQPATGAPTPPPAEDQAAAESRRRQFESVRLQSEDEPVSDLQPATGAPTPPPAEDQAAAESRRRQVEGLRRQALSDAAPESSSAAAAKETAVPDQAAEAKLGWRRHTASASAGLGRTAAAPESSPTDSEGETETPPVSRGLLGSITGRVRGALSGLRLGGPKEVTTLTIEHGLIKLMVSRGLEVVDHRIVPASPRLFREGLVSDSPHMASLLQRGLQEMGGRHRRVIGAVPGYQTTLRRLELPNAKGMDPNIIIPSEAQRTLGISLNNSSLAWHRLPGTAAVAHWLVLSATNRSISSLSSTAEGAGLKLAAVELRAPALARAINQPDAICAWVAADGCDVVVVRDWTPITHQCAYWGVGSTIESPDLVNRITEVVESAIVANDLYNPEMAVPADVPVYVTGSLADHRETVAQRVAANLRRSAAELEPPLALPPDFPVDDLVVNIGLALREA